MIANAEERRLIKRLIRHLERFPDAAWRTPEHVASSLKASVCEVTDILRRLEAVGAVQREQAGALEAWRTNGTRPEPRKQAGRPNGPVICLLEIPSIEIRTSETFYGHGEISKVRRYVLRWLTDRDIAGASFAVYATVRHRDNQGNRRRLLVRWKDGESVEAALAAARATWNALGN